ncbi:pre-mRNA-splicing factor SPP2 [Phanerochaete sordida]|uniref:Pre-mRNA-splicing factor SPP2 n=1 Tax=Phanerochaete sordida TaxID=48140 RepID=A0A9P3LLI7_9APHY|nr:pre-mRNA-splicing factor SPP2 [Phanerochaete sordida]
MSLWMVLTGSAYSAFFADSVHEKPKPQGPLVIPALKNRDWRDLARKRKNLYIPPSAAATTGADGSVGGLGTRDTINSGPQQVGLQVRKKIKIEEDEMEVEESVTESVTATVTTEAAKEEPETEDQKAIRALLEGASGEGKGPRVEIIPAPSEDDAFKQDVVELPESASLDDYERVPVEDFGAALLRGMGWKEGTAASRKGKGPVEPWLPQARPALLGIGAKEKEVFDDGSKGKKKTRPDKKYVPLVKREIRPGESERDSGSGGSSRRRSPEPRSSRRSPSPDRRNDRDRHDSDYGRDRKRDKEFRDKDRDRERERDRDRDYDRRRDDRREYESSSRRDKERDRDRDSRRDRSGERSSRRDRDRRDY